MTFPIVRPSAVVAFFRQSTTIHGIGALAGTAMALGLHQITAPEAASLGVMATLWIVMQQEPDLSQLPAAVAEEIQAAGNPVVLARTASQLAPALIQEFDPASRDAVAHRALDLAHLALDQLKSQGELFTRISQPPAAAAAAALTSAPADPNQPPPPAAAGAPAASG